MIRKSLILFSMVIFILASSLFSASRKGLPNLTERARKAWISEHLPLDSTELALIDRMKWLKVLRVTRNYSKAAHGESTYNRIKDLDLTSARDQRIFDSLLNAFLTEIDLLYNPDTPENEFEIEMLKRMKFCDDKGFGKWWISSDLRADIILQQGLDWLIYVPPFEIDPVGGGIDPFSPRTLCFHCQLSYPDRGIYLELEGKSGECFNRIVPFNEMECQGMFPPNDAEKWNKLFRAQEIFREEIAERPTPPAYRPFKSEKNLKMALRIFQRPREDGSYEIWSLVASPFNQFDRDSLKMINFGINQVIWSMQGIPEIYGYDSLGIISVEINESDRNGFYFSAMKSILYPGKWKFVLAPVEYSKDTNKTIFSINLEIPGDSNAEDLSDILLYLDGDKGKVEIAGKRYVGLPFSSFKNEHTLNAAVFSCKSVQSGTASIAWYLRPIKEKEYIIRGKPQVEEDSTMWIRWPEGSAAFDTALFPVRKFLERKDIVLACSETPNRQVFELKQPLADIPHGNYELRFLIMDPRLKDNKVRERMTNITIK